MLLSKEEYPEYGLDASDPSVGRKLAAVESTIRSVTNNQFHVRGSSSVMRSSEGVLVGEIRGAKAGDTVEIEGSELNCGLYAVKSAEGGAIALDSELSDDDANLVSLVRYPCDVVEGAVGILEYEKARPKGKAGISSETLSRRSVTYRDASGDGQLAGYPLEVTAFMRPYMRARF